MANFITKLMTKEEAIPILRVAKAADAVKWYSRLGFQQEWEHRFEPGFPAFVSIERQGVRLFLSEHMADATPDTLVYLRVKQIEPIAKEFGVQITKQEWADEVHLQDPDGNRLRIGTPKP
jgi:catechol 2,3-dioxygenase-like lactoylglutathione lyase family enzyme